MKKLTIVVLCIFIYSCSSIKPLKVEKKEIAGKWLVESITDNNKTKLSHDSLLLNDVALICFYDSIWKFDPDVDMGEYSINDLYCKFGKRKFSFHPKETIDTNGYYKFTLTPTQKKGKQITSKPFNFKLVKVSEMNMMWQCNILLNNKLTTININFKKLDKTKITER